MTSESIPITTSDEELACRAQRGCMESFDCLLRRFQTPVLQFLRNRGGEDAEDLTQETFLRAYENLHRYRPRWPFSSWLFTIARRASINNHRRARPSFERSDIDALASAGAEPLETLVADEGRRRLWDAAAIALNEEQATALWLFLRREHARPGHRHRAGEIRRLGQSDAAPRPKNIVAVAGRKSTMSILPRNRKRKNSFGDLRRWGPIMAEKQSIRRNSDR